MAEHMVFYSVSRGVTKQLSPARRRRLMEELAEIGLPKPAKLATGSFSAWRQKQCDQFRSTMPRPSSLREQPFRPSAPLGELTDDIESESPRRAALFMVPTRATNRPRFCP